MPLRNRKPLRRKTPLRAGGPLTWTRIKRKAPRNRPDKLEKRHLERVASLPCLVSGKPATVHHVTGYADRIGRTARSHKRVVPLAPEYHQHDHGLESVERLNHRGFYERFKIDLMKEAERLWEESCALLGTQD